MTTARGDGLKRGLVALLQPGTKVLILAKWSEGGSRCLSLLRRYCGVRAHLGYLQVVLAFANLKNSY